MLTLEELKTMHGKPVYIKFVDEEKTLPEVFKSLCLSKEPQTKYTDLSLEKSLFRY